MSITSQHHKTRISYTSLILLLLMLGVEQVAAYPQRVIAEEQTMQNLTDERIIVELKSHNEEEAHHAVEEIMQRGERMIPLLLQTKGNNQAFYGYGLGNHLAAFAFPSPTGDKKLDEGRVITVEVAALYLISAIYHKTLEFAQAPYLTDGTSVKWQKFNTPRRVISAWESVEKWARMLKTQGLESLRAKQCDPLKWSVVDFW
jgi:hypothetical protein